MAAVGGEGVKTTARRRRSTLIEENSFSDFYSAAEEEDETELQSQQKQATMVASLNRKGSASSKSDGAGGTEIAKVRPYRRKSQLGRQLEASVSNLSVPIQIPAQGLDFSVQHASRQVSKDSPSKSVAAAGSDIVSTRVTQHLDRGHAKVDSFVLQTTMKRIIQIGDRLESVQLGLSGDDKRGHRANSATRVDRSAALIPATSSSSSSGGSTHYTQYDLLEGLAKILRSVDDVDQMLDVKEEMSQLVEENYKLRAKEVEETCKLKVKEMEQSYRAKVTELNRKKQKEIGQIRKELESKIRKELDIASNSIGGNWSPGEKQKVLDDFNYLKGLYEKDRRKMEEMLNDANRQLRSRSAGSQSAYSPNSTSSLINDTLISSLQKRGSIIEGAGLGGARSSSVSPITKRNSVATGVSPLIYSFQDKIHDNLVGDMSMSTGSMAFRYDQQSNNGMSRHLNNGMNHSNGSSGLLTPNGGSSNSLDMVELVDILKAENTQLRMMVNTPQSNINY